MLICRSRDGCVYSVDEKCDCSLGDGGPDRSVEMAKSGCRLLSYGQSPYLCSYILSVSAILVFGYSLHRMAQLPLAKLGSTTDPFMRASHFRRASDSERFLSVSVRLSTVVAVACCL
jgi:hypothetical protein